MRNSSKIILGAAAAAVVATLVPTTVRATDYTWAAGAGTGLSWNANASWTPNTGFPNAIADSANFQVALGGNLSVNLNQAITVGSLKLGSTSTGTTDIGNGS